MLWLHTDKLALKAAGGKTGFPMTISTMQLGVGVLYALFAWIAPEMRDTPAPTMEDLTKMIPVSFCAAAAHSFSVFAQSAGAVSFAMIVKAVEDENTLVKLGMCSNLHKLLPHVPHHEISSTLFPLIKKNKTE